MTPPEIKESIRLAFYHQKFINVVEHFVETTVDVPKASSFLASSMMHAALLDSEWAKYWVNAYSLEDGLVLEDAERLARLFIDKLPVPK